MPFTLAPPSVPLVDAPAEATPDVDLDALVEAAVAAQPSFGSFASSVGRTPLIEVPGPPHGARILAKVESANPAGSVKDRVALALLAQVFASSDGLAGREGIVEYSGGNLGVALAQVCGETGVPLRLVLARGTDPKLLYGLRDRGAKVELVDVHHGFIDVIDRARDIALAEPGWRLLFQHRNPLNVLAHDQLTGREIVDQLGGSAPAAWVASVGSGGTFAGVARALRRVAPSVKLHIVTPAEAPYAMPGSPKPGRRYAGSGGLGRGVTQPHVRRWEEEVTAFHTVDWSTALTAMHRFLGDVGVRIGSSSAANWVAARRVAEGLTPDDTVITVLPCAGTTSEWKARR